MAAIISLAKVPRRPPRTGGPAGGDAEILLFTGVQREAGQSGARLAPGTREADDGER